MHKTGQYIIFTILYYKIKRKKENEKESQFVLSFKRICFLNLRKFYLIAFF